MTDRHDRLIIILHWLTALLIIALWVMGQTVDIVPSGPNRIAYRSLHIVFGFVLAILLPIRIFWRLSGTRMLPPLDTGLMAGLARLMHAVLYLLMIAAIVVGVMNTWVRGDSLFGLWSFTSFAPGDRDLRRAIGGWHELAANATLFAAILHAGAALYHHHIQRDATLRRMLPWSA